MPVGANELHNRRKQKQWGDLNWWCKFLATEREPASTISRSSVFSLSAGHLSNRPHSCVYGVLVPRPTIICACRFKTLHVSVMACRKIMARVYTRQLLSVTALTKATINMPKFYGHLPCPAAGRWWVLTSLQEDGRTDGGHGGDSQGPGQLEQLQQAGVSSPFDKPPNAPNIRQWIR